ncbi:MAG: hypothetical protein ACYS8Z_02775, partial [Planctomycetota bacterium]
MKTQDTYNKNLFRLHRPAACPSVPLLACVMSVILYLLSAPAIAASESAPAEPNAPKIAQPDDPNSPQTTPQNTATEPNQPPKPTIDDAVTSAAAPQPAAKSARRDWLIAGLPKSDLARRVWKERITVPQEDEAGERKIQLQQLID